MVEVGYKRDWMKTGQTHLHIQPLQVVLSRKLSGNFNGFNDSVAYILF
jgi:hypothetical protein